ncbi:MAG: hypothetical protein IKQ67_02895 [Candidatus Methanomethylophilaceae archaeon]|nr:hypothetical protein [Candidatus Methanomethylophilaceae archaeon]
MAMYELYSVMEPGRVYFNEDLMRLLSESGYRVTDPGVIVSSVYKLYRAGRVVRIFTGIHMVPVGDDTERILNDYRN